MDETREAFIKDRENKYCGKIVHQTFTKFIGQSNKREIIHLNGTLYIIDKKIYFEDFEPQLSPLTTYGGRPKYNKVEFTIDMLDIDNIGVLPEKFSKETLSYPDKITEIIPIKKGFRSFFIRTDLFIKLNNGQIFIFNFPENFNEEAILNKIIDL